MGSPEAEAGRYDDEGPHHEVTLSQGFWLGDTACTQALWEAVMGENPSLFKGAELPVEHVSFENVQGFLERLNSLVPGLALTLPTEAQWEYACRAGTTTAFSFGKGVTTGQVNFDGYPYAGQWKGLEPSNSGEWTGLNRRETVTVRSLPSNAWGLYEMHGNVWEWCLDGMRAYGAEAVQDPTGLTEPGAKRVVRGGCWLSDARDVRCAYRSWPDRGDRIGYLGFRFARVQQQVSARKPAV